jgi:hypothetical protein
MGRYLHPCDARRVWPLHDGIMSDCSAVLCWGGWVVLSVASSVSWAVFGAVGVWVVSQTLSKGMLTSARQRLPIGKKAWPKLRQSLLQVAGVACVACRCLICQRGARSCCGGST